MVSLLSVRSVIHGIQFNSEQLMPWLVRSRAELGELKGFGEMFRSRQALLQPYLLMDAVENCLLEGVQVTRDSVLESQLFNEAEQTPEIRQVIRYRNAVQLGMELLAAGPLTKEGLQAIHTSLCGSKPAGRSKRQLPAMDDEHSEALDQILAFSFREDNQLDPLARCIVAFGLFEVLRPVPDCNEGLGRVFLTLMLVQSGLIRFPVISINSYLRKNRDNIQRLIQDPSMVSNWSPFIKYMMHGFSNQARETREGLEKLLRCFDETDQAILAKCPEIHTPELVFMLHALPVISPLRLSSRLDIHYTTATRYLKRLETEGFLQNRQSGKYQLYLNRRLVDLLVH